MRKGIIALGLGIALAAPAAAQGVDEIIAKHVDAMGGMEKIKSVKSVRMTGTMGLGQGIEAPIVLEIKRPNALRRV